MTGINLTSNVNPELDSQHLRQEPLDKPHPDLEPIDEKNHALEQAFADLEEEFRREEEMKR